MMGFSLGHLIVLLVIILLFGGRRLPELGGALGKGLRSFKRGIEGKLDDESEGKQYVESQEEAKPASAEAQTAASSSSAESKKDSDGQA